MTPQALLNNFPIISDQIDKRELEIILTSLYKILASKTVGDIVEFGCYAGTTSLFMQRMLLGNNRQFHVYDSFAGLPTKSYEDQSPIGYNFVPGELLATKQTFIKNFKRANLPLPVIHKGWFNELTSEDIPNKIALAFLDGDYFESISRSLKLIDSRLVSGSIVIVDDYMNEALPGAKKAVDEWQKRRNVTLRREASLAIMNVS